MDWVQTFSDILGFVTSLLGHPILTVVLTIALIFVCAVGANFYARRARSNKRRNKAKTQHDG
jgi:hypothetical protein